MKTMMLTPGAVTLRDLFTVLSDETAVVLDPACRDGVEKAAARIAKAAAGDVPVYGVNTGFGKLASIKIENKDTQYCSAI
jgi:histidine ammonia-lyase